MTLRGPQTATERPGRRRIPRPATPAGVLLRCLIAAVGMMLCAYAVVIPVLIPGAERWASAVDADDVTVAFIIVQLAVMTMPLLAGLVVLGVMTRIEGVRWIDYTGGAGVRASLTGVVVSSIAAAAVTVAAAGVAQAFGFDADRGVALDAAGVPVVLVVVIGVFRAYMMQGIQEELWFRGFAFRGITERPWLVLLATTLTFTALHLVSQGGQQSVVEHVLYLALALGMGFWAGVERWCTGSVWAAVGVHGGIHMGLTVVSIAGWPLGPVTWIAIGLALIIAALTRLGIRRPWSP